MHSETPQINPYGAPQAPVGDYVPGNHAVLERARSVSADHGVAWYREAWRIFKMSPGVWIGIWAAFFAIVVLISFLPIIGGLIVGVVTPLFAGGALTAARNADREGGARFAELFGAFSGPVGTLLLIGVLQLVLSFIVGIVVALIGVVYLGSIFAGSPSFDRLMSPDVIVPLAVMAVVTGLIFLPITNAVWLASGLCALEGTTALDALRRAFNATFRNLLPLLVFGLVTLALAVVALIPLGLGVLVLGPLILCAIYAQYKDLFDATGDASPTASIP